MPTVRAMAERGTPFKGVLYAGLMIKDGVAKLIEYNVRFGDPEAQVLMLRLRSDLLPALLAVAEGQLSGVTLDWHDDTALCVVMAAKGYPGAYAKGLRDQGARPGRRRSAACRSSMPAPSAKANRILADGGRVLGVTARGQDIREAQSRAYAAIDQIDLAGRLLSPRHRLARAFIGTVIVLPHEADYLNRGAELAAQRRVHWHGPQLASRSSRSARCSVFGCSAPRRP